MEYVQPAGSRSLGVMAEGKAVVGDKQNGFAPNLCQINEYSQQSSTLRVKHVARREDEGKVPDRSVLFASLTAAMHRP